MSLERSLAQKITLPLLKCDKIGLQLRNIKKAELFDKKSIWKRLQLSALTLYYAIVISTYEEAVISCFIKHNYLKLGVF